MSQGHAHCLVLWATTLDLWIEITKSRMFVIQEFNWITKFWSHVPTVLQAKTAQQGKQMRVGACEGFPYHSVELILLAKGNRHKVDFNRIFKSGKAFYPFTVMPCSNCVLFDTHSEFLTVGYVVCDQSKHEGRLECTFCDTYQSEMREVRINTYHMNRHQQTPPSRRKKATGWRSTWDPTEIRSCRNRRQQLHRGLSRESSLKINWTHE